MYRRQCRNVHAECTDNCCDEGDRNCELPRRGLLALAALRLRGHMLPRLGRSDGHRSSSPPEGAPPLGPPSRHSTPESNTSAIRRLRFVASSGNQRGSPRMNAIAERWIGGCRRELLDRTLIWNQAHLRQILREYET